LLPSPPPWSGGAPATHPTKLIKIAATNGFMAADLSNPCARANPV